MLRRTKPHTAQKAKQILSKHCFFVSCDFLPAPMLPSIATCWHARKYRQSKPTPEIHTCDFYLLYAFLLVNHGGIFFFLQPMFKRFNLEEKHRQVAGITSSIAALYLWNCLIGITWLLDTAWSRSSEQQRLTPNLKFKVKWIREDKKCMIIMIENKTKPFS